MRWAAGVDVSEWTAMFWILTLWQVMQNAMTRHLRQQKHVQNFFVTHTTLLANPKIHLEPDTPPTQLRRKRICGEAQ